jgi:hypothetical protein
MNETTDTNPDLTIIKLVFCTHTKILRATEFTPPPILWWCPCCSSFYFFALSYYVSLRPEFRVCCPLQFPSKWCSVRLYLHLFVGGLMSYLRYLCLFAYSGVQHILCCISVLFFFVLCTLCCQVSLDCPFWLPLRYSLTFI